MIYFSENTRLSAHPVLLLYRHAQIVGDILPKNVHFHAQLLTIWTFHRRLVTSYPPYMVDIVISPTCRMFLFSPSYDTLWISWTTQKRHYIMLFPNYFLSYLFRNAIGWTTLKNRTRKSIWKKAMVSESNGYKNQTLELSTPKVSC